MRRARVGVIFSPEEFEKSKLLATGPGQLRDALRFAVNRRERRALLATWKARRPRRRDRKRR